MNILIVGLGSIGRKHINALRSLDGSYEIYALRSNHTKSDIKDVHNIYNVDDTSVIFDFAIISNPTYLHFETIEALIKKNIPLFIEKPVLHTLNNSTELVNSAELKGLKTYVACNLRFHPSILQLKKNILNNSSNLINEVNIYCGSYLPDWRPGTDFRKSYSSNSEMGGGVHLDLFHEIDYAVWLFGMPNLVHKRLRSVSSLKIESIDSANYLLEYDNFNVNVQLNYFRRIPKREIEIVFELNTLVVDLITSKIINNGNELLFYDSNYSINKTYSDQLEYFITSLRNKTHIMNSLRESIDILKIVLNE